MTLNGRKDPDVAVALQHLRDAALPGWEIEDEAGALRLQIERQKNPQLRLEAAVLDFIGHWSLQDKSKTPKSTRGWWAAWRNWCNNAVRFGNWYAVADTGRPAAHLEHGAQTVKPREPKGAREVLPRPIAAQEVVDRELARVRSILGGGG